MTSPAQGQPYSTTAASITLRPDLADCVAKVDVLTQIQDHKFSGFSGKEGSVAVQLTRSGNTWTLPKPLSSYPRGNRPNCYRIRLSGFPPDDVSFYRTIMQTFVQDGARPGVFEPPTTR